MSGGRTRRSAPAPSRLAGARRAPLARWLAPELATLVRVIPSGDDWLHESKFDGYRILCRLSGGKAHLYSRNAKDWTERFAPVAQAATKLPAREAWLDGEVVVLLPDGTSSFQALQNFLSQGRERDLTYYVFDLLHWDGYDLTGVAIEERKRVLQRLVSGRARGTIRYSDHVRGQGPDFLREACRRRLEGAVSKRAGSPYRSGRGRDWVKTKCSEQQEFVVGGFTEPEGSRIGIGSLLLGVYERGGLVYAGKVGTGFTSETLRTLRRKLESLEVENSPFVDLRRATGAHWVKPKLVGEVSFTSWTSDGRLRHPSFQGLREDKAPTEIVRERKPTPVSRSKPDKSRPRGRR